MMNLPGHSSGQLHVLVFLASSQYITMSLLVDGVEPTWRRMVHPKTQSMVKVHGVRNVVQGVDQNSVQKASRNGDHHSCKAR